MEESSDLKIYKLLKGYAKRCFFVEISKVRKTGYGEMRERAPF